MQQLQQLLQHGLQEEMRWSARSVQVPQVVQQLQHLLQQPMQQLRWWLLELR